ncbi:hypothetical protein GQ53DRAFT_242755 [Thozetella sp. PMI_491]|nr:hypothetical protein GQ53DRAFT_242755 [Thozetella sp. PMI_491]
MAPQKKSGKASLLGGAKSKDGKLSAPFKPASDSLKPFFSQLSRNHVYIAHIDPRPRALKRKVFVVPVLMNIAVALLFVWRVYYIGPYYIKVITSTIGYENETTVKAAESTYSELTWVVLSRGFTFLLDFVLFVFVWPWPVEFCIGQSYGSPVYWRWKVGFQDTEIYVRRSRNWDLKLGDVLDNSEGRDTLLTNVRAATTPMLLQQKTGYLTMNGEWDLDWAAMVLAHSLVDNKSIAVDAFRTLVLLHHKERDWLCIEMQIGEGAKEDERRRQVFAFRDALAAVGKEELFYRWIEVVQFEATQPGGFGPEKQVEVAQKIRDLFQAEGINFDEFWKESVGTDSLAGMM